MKNHVALTILETLTCRGDGLTYRFQRTPDDVETVRAGELAARICGFAAGLRERGLDARAVLPIIATDPSRVWTAFVGAMAAGAIPCVMAAPTFKTHVPTYVRNLTALLARYGTRTALVDRGASGKLQPVLAGIEAIELETLERTAASPPPIAADGADTAFLQHSSGSTGIPKGVALSHDAVLGHLATYARTLALTNEDRIASWLPLYHDMGLVTSFLLPLVHGVACTTLPPDRWIMDPLEILRVVARERSTLAWWPNFAFALLARRAGDEDLGACDLSSLRQVINCSEPVMAGSVDAFADRLARHGLARSALHTCYAMAENVFAVTQSGPGAPRRGRYLRESLSMGSTAAPAGEDDRSGVTLLSSGRAIPGAGVTIVDEARAACPPGRVGEIAITGGSLFTGYHCAPDLTAPVREPERYFTGDVGFLDGGELYVLGRTSDLVIVGGRKFHPGDIEAVAAEVDGIKEGRVVAFGVTSESRGTQELVVLAESELHASAPDVGRMKRELKARVQSRIDVTVDHARIVAPRSLAKTSSGKLARKDNREWFLKTLSGGAS